MLSKLRSFKESKFAMVLVAIIIIPFVFWGMGGAFQSGNTNSIGKINNYNISTQDFLEHINSSGIKETYIKENIDKGILEDLLRDLVSEKILDLEIKSLGISISEEILAEKIKRNEIFHDENKNFSRIAYEKFLLENNISAPQYEMMFKKNEEKNILFNYISKGVNSPYFIANQRYIDETKKVEIKFLDLNNSYKKKFTNKEVEDFINSNKTDLIRDEIDFSYIKLSPENLTETKDFDKQFYEKIDEIENMILNESKIVEIKNKYKLELSEIRNYHLKDSEKNSLFKDIYLKRNEDKIQILDKNNYFLLYEISNINEVLPNMNNLNFVNEVNQKMLMDNKNKLHKDLFEKISQKKMDDTIFKKLTNNYEDIKTTVVEGSEDTSLFEINSIKIIYSLPKESYVLIADEKKNIYLGKILNVNFSKLEKNSNIEKQYIFKGNKEIKENLYSSYDLYINTKYKVKLNEKTLERVKNYFN